MEHYEFEVRITKQQQNKKERGRASAREVELSKRVLTTYKAALSITYIKIIGSSI